MFCLLPTTCELPCLMVHGNDGKTVKCNALNSNTEIANSLLGLGQGGQAGNYNISICIYLSLSPFSLHRHLRRSISSLSNVYAYIIVYIYIWYVGIYKYKHIYIYIYVYTHTYIYMSVCTYVRAYICTYMDWFHAPKSNALQLRKSSESTESAPALPSSFLSPHSGGEGFCYPLAMTNSD